MFDDITEYRIAYRMPGRAGWYETGKRRDETGESVNRV